MAILDSRNSSLNRGVSLSKEPITPEQHDLWFEQVLASVAVSTFAFEFRGALVYYLTLSRSEGASRVGVIRGCDLLPHPALGALMPLISLEISFSIPDVDTVSTETLASNIPALRSRRLLSLDSLGSTTEVAGTIKQSLERDEYTSAKELIWQKARDLFGNVVCQIREECAIEFQTP